MNWQTVTTTPDLLGESPFWHPQEQMLYWVDIPGKKVHRLKPCADTGTRDVQSWDLPQEPGCIAPARRGGLVLALREGVYRALHWGGTLEKIVPAPFDTTTTRFNDGKCDALGRLWAGTVYEPRNARLAELYCIDARGTVEQHTAPRVASKQGDAVVANGLAWSPDNTRLYWADTTHHVIYVWDWEAVTSAMTNRRVFHQFASKPVAWTTHMAQAGSYGGRPDGSAVDVQGNYYVAMFEGQRLLKFASTGELLAEIPTPTRCTTMPCFGGEDLKTLFITTASYNRSAEELVAQPLAGHVFSMRVEVPGLPVNFFED